MFSIILSWISHLWNLLCESLSSSPSQSPPSSPSHSIPPTNISQDPSSPASYSTCWDVFLSFRGSDTRNKFTSHLYDKLDSNGIQTFKDDPELRRGEVISDALLDAIRKSKAYIVVLSENYASSSWCLEELAEILSCYKKLQRLVIPVFYNINPAVVRHQTGSFTQAFQKHHVRFERERVKNWRLALTQVASFSGYHVSENRSEADVINEIVAELLLKINPKTLHVTKYPVGLDSRVKAITTLLSNNGKGVIKFGIYGMGGVGKTTLAKALFNQLIRGGRFKGSCFLANVRENSVTAKGLVSLQMQLINDVLSSTTKFEFHNVDQGIRLIEARICSTKCVVVIDDLDNLEQFQSLVGPFASESVVIITTRNEEILIKTEVAIRNRYMLNTLDDADSLALFMRHAFGNAEANDVLTELSKDIVCLAGGLPLALEVFGSYLYKRSEVGWKSYIERLHRNPVSSIQQRLVISLDALDSDDPILKKIFLDISCFVGWKKQEVVQILENYYPNADHYIDMLEKRCLLTISSYDRLGMHDMLQDMGREITFNNSRNEPEKHSRLWVTEDIHDVLKNHKGTEAIECIIFRKHEFSPEELAYTTETFERMSKLRFLYLNKVNLTGSFEQVLDNLSWLCWDQCPLECLPSGFYPQKLVALEFPYSNMRTLWELNNVSHVFGKLKALNMSYSRYLVTTPDFIKLPSLETVNLKGCKSLKKVHISIGSLVSLVSLDLEFCKKLRSLPDTICNLRALEVLNISGCNRLKALPTQLGNIKSLRKLYADGLTVSKLPESIGHLSELVELHLSLCRKLETLPYTICNLKSLGILKIGGCSGLEALPMEIGNIKSLKEIDVKALTVSKLPDSFGHLIKIVELNLSNNWNLETLPDSICNLRSLEILSIFECKNIEILPDQLWKLTSLRVLNAFGATRLKRLPDIESSQIALSLQKLVLYESCITALPSGFSQLSNLEKLDISRCNHLFSIPKLPPSLKWIEASYCGSLERLPNLSNLKQLEMMDLSCCFGLTEIEGFEELTSLRELNLRDCSGLTYIQGLEDVVKKLVMDINALKLVNPLLQDIFLDIACFFIGWEEKKVVQILETYYTNVDHNIDILMKTFLLKINDRDELEMDKLLQHLGRKMARNNSLEEPERHSRLWLSVDIYDVFKSHKGTEVIEGIVPRKVFEDALEGESFTLKAFQKMRKLRFLYLKKVHLTGSFEQTFENLRWLCWDSCPSKCLPSEFYPPKLVILELPRSKITTWKLNMVPHVFEKLKTLDMSDSEDLTTTPDFSKLPCLETLILKGCKSLEEIHISIGSLVRLVFLDLHSCVKLRSLPDTICNLRALKVLSIGWCSDLEALPLELGDVKSLAKLNACGLTVSKLPNSIQRLSKLVELRLRSNKNLETLPDAICNLRSLEILDIYGCEKLDILLDQLFKVTSLRELIAGGATLLKISPHIESSQIALSLQKLDFSGIVLTALPSSISQLLNLEVLNLKGCMRMERLPNLSNLKRMEYLNLEDCSGLTEIQGLKGLTSIRTLHLEGCNSSLLACIFTESFFQMYSQFGHPIHICSTKFPDWISKSTMYCRSTMYLDLPPNVSHKYLGMILCIRTLSYFTSYSVEKTSYYVKKTPSDVIWRGLFENYGYKKLMVIVPRSTFLVKDGDYSITVKVGPHVEIYGVHLLYGTEEYDSTTLNED